MGGGNSSDGLEDELKSPNTLIDHQVEETLSASFRKLKEETEVKKPVDEYDGTSRGRLAITGFRLFDMEVLCNVLWMLRCHQCGELNLLFTEDKLTGRGAPQVCVYCARIEAGNIYFILLSNMERALR